MTELPCGCAVGDDEPDLAVPGQTVALIVRPNLQCAEHMPVTVYTDADADDE